jgi:hypothetical protein
VCYGSDVFGKKEFGVENDAEVADMGAPRDDRELKADWGWDGGTAFGEMYCFSFVDVDAQFPFGKILMKGRCGLGESVDYCVSTPGLSENCSVVGV